ncbi:MAG: hypothetical protein CVV64_05180 [Candidatus Wallbacteria bacterium HGW-Wallbacteria-1]|uniref:histidine kinase n=1 Tax=Candidatus Wallbacteria bacterium HGW-Wallbacteria-1 TaxID=2013854 RepID=A0A2N1PS50_9BACT|nr:MAG: hypothetical protein CVV64_05180 [Candidatus Wallbacteria bacterium HGW-Wallbacteria-1]
MSKPDSRINRDYIPKLLLSIVVAVVVSILLGTLTVYTLRSNLLLRNQVELGLRVRARSDAIGQFIQARKREIHLLGKPETLQGLGAFSLDPMGPEAERVHQGQALIMEFLSDRYDGIYIADSSMRVILGFRTDVYGKIVRTGNMKLSEDLPFKVKKEFFGRGHGRNESRARLIEINREGYSTFELVLTSSRATASGELFYILAHCSSERYMGRFQDSASDSIDEFFLLDQRGQVVVHSKMKMVGRNLSGYPWIRNRLIEQGGAENYTDREGSYLINACMIPDIQCLLCVIRPFNSFTRDLDQIKGIAILVAMAIFGLAVIVGWYILNLVLKFQTQRMDAQAQLLNATQAMAYSQELEGKNQELSRVNAQLEILHGENLDEKNRVLAIINTITDAILVTDSEFLISFMNSRACYLFQIDSEDIQGQHVSEVYTEKWFLESVMKLSEGNAGVLREERTIMSPNGDPMQMECTFLPLASGKGDRRGYVATLRDVTRERELDRLKSEFISVVSHELRTPLASIKGTVEIMIAGILGPIAQEQREFLQVMLGETDRLIRLISDILDLEKMESGKMSIRIEQVDIVAIMREVVSSSSALGIEKGLKVETNLPQEETFAKIDPDKFRQIIHNLLSNAIKYTDRGKVSAGLTTTGDRVRFWIADTGMGIDSSRLAVVFDKFYQVDSSSTRKTGGTGLGLPITRRIVELHGGIIWVDSIPGQGSTFFVELPRWGLESNCTDFIGKTSNDIFPDDPDENAFVKEPEKAVLQMSDASGLGIARITRALIIEDDEVLGNTMSKILQQHFQRVSLMGNVTQGLRAVEELKPDVLFLDLNLPDRSGMETIPLVRSISPRTRILVVTGNSDLTTAVESMRAGASDYLLKPFPLERFEEVALSALNSVPDGRPLPAIPEVKCDVSSIVGESRWTRDLENIIRRVSRVEELVLITGESGVGKELIARAIHRNSRRFGRPFIAVNCGALARELLESELFGHIKGSFTGAWEDKAGLFQAASGGTLFLDEIGEAPPEVQVKLLRVIQEGQVTPVGGVKPLDVDVRLLAATNRDLKSMVNKRTFREDLYYRIDVLNINIPPLRERPEDILPISRNYIFRRAEELGRNIEPEPDFMEAIQKYSWPGNVRELENILSRAIVSCEGNLLRVEHLPVVIREAEYSRSFAGKMGDGSYREEKKRAVDTFDRHYIERLLQNCGGNVAAAARKSGMHAKNLHDKIRETGIDPDKYRNN